MITVKSRKVQVLVALVSLVFVILIKSSPAYAFTGHVLSGMPFGAGAAGELSNPLGVAVDNSEGPSAGDVYVADNGNGRVLKFSSTGNFISEISGLTGPQYVTVDPTNGDLYVSESDNSVAKFDSAGNLITSFGVAGRIHNSGGEQYEFGPTGLAVEPTTGDLVVANAGNGSMDKFESTGTFIDQFATGTLSSPESIAIDGAGNVYVSDPNLNEVIKYSPSNNYAQSEVLDARNPQGVATDSSTGSVYVGVNGPSGYYVQQYDSTNDRVSQFGGGHIQESYGLAVNPITHAVYVVDRAAHLVSIFEPAGPEVTTSAPEHVTSTSATLAGHIEPTEGEEVTECYFEYGTDNTYGHKLACTAETPYDAPSTVTAELTNLLPGAAYHFRLVARDSNGQSDGQDRHLSTPQAPLISGVYSSSLTETSADIQAEINPAGSDTHYQIEYGPTESYGSTTPSPEVDVGSGESPQSVDVPLRELVPHTTYHFRVVAHNMWGTTTSEDQTFNFFPSQCPNETLRQQTNSSFLPDCRAYEIVSPGDAGNVNLEPFAAPAAPYSDNRVAFYGKAGAVSGTDPTNGLYGSTYVATRTNTGWITKYTGLRGYEALAESSMVSDRALDTLMNFENPEGIAFIKEPENRLPYIWSAEGQPLGQWPNDAAGISGAVETNIGLYQPSPDFSHLAFSSTNVAFAPGGLVSEPGSAYDYDVATASTSVISKLPDGDPIGGGPGPISFPAEGSGDPAQSAPGVSENGSRIVMSVAGVLYMRINDAATEEISSGKPVQYAGMTADGSEVFFTSAEQLTAADHDTSTDLYMWTESTGSSTLISTGLEGTGNTDSCDASWTERCDIQVVHGSEATDSAIASQSGAVYFYSPEQLIPDRGITNQPNVYEYEDGQLRYVTTLESGQLMQRVQVSPSGAHMAFLTSSRVTSYNNAGFREMYSYLPSSGSVRCVSCNPDGQPPTANVKASSDGIFMTNDGRTFFSTTDGLVPQDTDAGVDVYEYVAGRPQLITTGTFSVDKRYTNKAELIGVSADGINVIFSTPASLVGQDKNGPFLKIYDARTDGGFPYVPPPAPCTSADECVGPSSSQPEGFPAGTVANLGESGNETARRSKRHRHQRHRGGHLKRRRGRRRSSFGAATRGKPSVWTGLIGQR